jgi:Ca-activated chloride channel family protein
VALTPAADSSAGVGALWARSKIASLMDEITRGGDTEMIRPQVVKVALDHHLVSAYTSLVAVDLTPTAPAMNPKSAMVKASLPQGYVDGTQLPQTDTPATLQLLLGLIALASAAMFAVAGRRAGAAS